MDDIVHEQTIICRQSFASHVVGSLPVKRNNNNTNNDNNYYCCYYYYYYYYYYYIIIIIIIIIVLYGGSNFFIWMKSYGVTIQLTPLQQHFL